ncbi:hypothetical protein HDU80_000158 [Chytriomyces hyalinus]|nr:hypothetical protein HDU80_000158 [Chytriomyces hyalinus]
MDVKAVVPTLRPFLAPILNSKLRQMRNKIKGPGAPHVAFPGMCRDTSQALATTPVRPVPPKHQKPDSPKKSTVVDTNTKAVVRAIPFASTLHLHNLMRFMDKNTGLHHVQIILRIVTDHEIMFNVTADGKQLVYLIKPKTVSAKHFIDPTQVSFDYSPNQAIIQYFHNDPGTEEFSYTINLPEPVDSNCISSRSVMRTVERLDTSGHLVQFQQPVAKVLVYMVSASTSAAQRESSTSSTTAATASHEPIARYWKSSNARFTSDGIAYLKRQRDEQGITAKAEHATQRRMIADLFECSEASVKVLAKNWFNNAKPAGQRKKSPGESPVVLQETHQSLEVMRQTSAPSVEAQRSTLDVSDLRAATRKKTENGYQIFKREEADVFRTVALPEHAMNLKGRSRNQMVLGQASKVISSKWKNLSQEERAVYEAKASQANAEPLELVRHFDSETKAEASSKLLSQIGKSLELLEAMGWSYMIAGINAETNLTFKEFKGTPAKLANAEYVRVGMELQAQLTAGQIIARAYPDVAKLVEKNKTVQQDEMEHLALLSLNGCLAEKGLKPFHIFPWIQVQSKRVFNRSFYFVNWPANIPLKRSLTITECETIIRMFTRQVIHGSLGVEQAEVAEISSDYHLTICSFQTVTVMFVAALSDPSSDIENQQAINSNIDLGGEDLFNFPN